MRYFMIISTVLTLFSTSYLTVNGELIATSSSHDDLLEMLNTEKVLIDGLRQYIETQEQKLSILQRKTLEIQNIHDGVGHNRVKYLNNPINAVTMLKRFTSDWKGMTSYAEDYLDTEDLTKNITQQKEELTFPTEDDYDSALISLLRIQDMFKLEPQRLSVGEVNGIKIGSEMSWSDCLEIGLKSSKNGYQTYAKYWMETALEKIPQQPSSNTNATETESKVVTHTNLDEYNVKARMEVFRALLNVEYKAGNLNKALTIANEMLDINPQQKNVIKAIQQIKKELKKKKYIINKEGEAKQEKKTAIKKTDEELMIEEICREATSSQQQQQIHTASLPSSPLPTSPPQCSLVTDNQKWLILQPLKVEWLSLDPFIVIYHQALSGTQLDELKEFVVEKEDGSATAADDTMQLTKIGLKKMRQINEKLHYVTGHGRDALDPQDWLVNRYNFENMMEVETASQRNAKDAGKRQAGLLFNLQQPLLGGSTIFPQLELSVNLPKGSVLYWSALNEFGLEDYRSKYHICPVIGGTQLTATAYVRL